MSSARRRLLRRVAAAGAIAGTLGLARTPAPTGLDRRATAALGRPRSSTLDRAVGAFTDIGSVFGLAGCSITLALGGAPRLGVRTTAAGSVAWVAAQLTKDLVDRQRPYELGTAELLISVPHGSSWPSGHAAVAGAMADTVAHELTPLGAAGAWAVAVGVALSRLHVGAHHASDVVAGLALGALAAEVTRLAADAIEADAAG